MEAQLKGQSTTQIATRVPLLPAKAAALRLESRGATVGPAMGAPSARLSQCRGCLRQSGGRRPTSSSTGSRSGRGDRGRCRGCGVRPAGAATRPDVVVEGVTTQVRRIPIGPRRRPAEPGRPLHADPTPGSGVEPGRRSVGVARASWRRRPGCRRPGARNFGVGLSVGVESHFDTESAGGIARTKLTTLLFEVHQRFFPRGSRTFFALATGFATSFGRTQSLGATVTGHGSALALEGVLESGFSWATHTSCSRYATSPLLLDELSKQRVRVLGNAAGAVADMGYRLTW